jgi:hypothetical protein
VAIYNGTVERGSGGARRGEVMGEVFCPQLRGAIARMRCWERQIATGCGFSCQFAVKREEITKLRRAMMLQTAKPIEDDADAVLKYDRCIECGNEKSLNPSPRCHACAGELRQKEGKR